MGPRSKIMLSSLDERKAAKQYVIVMGIFCHVTI